MSTNKMSRDVLACATGRPATAGKFNRREIMQLPFPAPGRNYFHMPDSRAFLRCVIAAACAAILLTAIAPAARAQNYADDSRWELGGHFALLNLPYQCSGQTNCNSGSSGFGGNLSYNLSSWVSLDSEMNFFPDNGNSATMETGGQVTEGLFGLRVGPTTRKWGFYSVLRPGFVSFSRVLSGTAPGGVAGAATGQRQFTATLFAPDAWRSPTLYSAQTLSTASLGFSRSTNFALNYGEAIEYRPIRHLALRFDIGDTIVTYPGVSVLGPFKQHNFQISQAFVIRF
ncbi:MAG TPA: outer membrane beta-barrel protein [Candidatus Acidoferrales bacterium]|nr:outer membrane beta-barrel protein [Candidatus Acidoferrales bacterium]